MDLNDLTIAEVLHAVDNLELDPLIAINEERNGRNRKTLISALDARIANQTVPQTVIIPDEAEEAEPEAPENNEAEYPLPPDLYASSRGIISCRLKNNAPSRVTVGGAVNCTFMRRSKPFKIPREYWMAVLKRTGLFEEVKK